tara:strand:- start:824 stop:1741 length:918 start_codon:yes stop_codon:yes gene_type:complete
MSYVMAGGALLSIGGGIFGASKAKKAARAAARRAAMLQGKLDKLVANRQEVINPHEDTKSLAHLAQDLSGMVSNPFANLSVSTKAAEIQIEESDIALANTLDTLRATGSSAGGATALAQAALRSKKGVAASIETQEAQNEKMKAQGEQGAQQRFMGEKSRVQGIQISEGGREQNAQAAGKQFAFGVTEGREQQQIDRTASLLDQAMGNKAQAQADETNAVTGTLSSLGGMLGGLSDRRAKTNIVKIGLSPSGLNIYTFEYKNKDFGEGVFQGVMSDEIPKSAIIKHADGFDRVDYSRLDVEFKQV